jgi:tetratricopeptide (TPR) repeat protein
MTGFEKRRGRLCFAVLAAVIGGLGSGPAATTASLPDPARTASAGPTDRLLSLDYAFRFASAIHDDPKDRAKAQELALEAYTAEGAYDVVAQRAEQIDGWRRGLVYADLATVLARQGRAAEARANIDKAEAVRATVEGWQNPRISAHVAEAWALLGETEKAAVITAGLATADPIQYAGRATATDAVALATKGEFQQAFARLLALEENDDIDVASARTNGYLALAENENAPLKGRQKALDAARASALRLPLELRVDALLRVAAQSAALGRARNGRSAVSAALSAVEDGAPASSERIPYLIEIGRAWARLGEPQKAREALERAGTFVNGALSIDRPGLLARIASGYRQIPDEARARSFVLTAMDAAAEMPLSRPRALSLSAICRQMGQDGVTPEGEVRARLDALLAGLGDR